MLEGLEQLLEMQRLDDECNGYRQEQAAAPQRRAELQQAREDAEADLARARAGVAEAEGGQRGAESDLQDKEALLQKLEGQQFQVKSNEAYTALLHEIEAAKQAISDCETRILESMEAIERARADLAEAEQRSSESGERIAAEEREIAEREGVLAGEIDRLGKRRTELAGQIDSALLARYEKIASRRRPTVVIVTQELCGGCRVDIPPQAYIEILRGEQIVTCGNCQRILVHGDRVAAPAC